MSRYEIMPYDGKENITDGSWLYVWHKMVEQGKDKLVFHNDTVTSPYEFLHLMKKQVLPSLVIDTELQAPVALGWLTECNGNMAFSHWMIFNEVWESGDAAIVGSVAVDFWFNKLNLNLLLGVMPAQREFGIKFMRDLGCTIFPPIPHLVHTTSGPVAGVLGYLTKETFNG